MNFDTEFADASSRAKEFLRSGKSADSKIKMVTAFVFMLSTFLKKGNQKLDELSARLANLEAHHADFKYMGTWQSGREYRKGNFCTHAGSIWHANEHNVDKPGASNSWTLAVKSGDR